MSKKPSITIGLLLVVIGVGLVPAGYFTNNYLRDQVAAGVPEALLATQEEAVPTLEDQIPGISTPDVLLGTEDQAVTQLESQLPVLATPQVLGELRDNATAQLPAIINGSGTAQFINGTIDAVAAGIGLTAAIGQYFNSSTFQADYTTPIQGVSDYYDTLMGDLDVIDLGYTPNAQNYLLFGNGPLPGLITDLDLGLGVLGFMELYLNASLGDQGLNNTMQYYYNATWTQLSYLAGYIRDYMWDVVVKSTYAPTPIEIIAEIDFYAQWANGTLVDDGIDLSLFEEGLPSGTKGLEAGVPTPTGIILPTCQNLWTVLNPYAFVNDTGILVWVGAMQGNTTLQTLLIGTFSLSAPQLGMVLAWLGNFMSTLTPALILAETGYTIPVLAQLSFHEQWAVGTIMGESFLPGGFLSQIDPSFAGAPYLEVGIPTPSTLDLARTANLWNDTDPHAFVNDDGIKNWLGAITGDTTQQTTIASTFSLSPAELTLLLSWLGAFITTRVPQLLQYETGHTVPELAQLAFYEQWANGTINGESFLPAGFLSEMDTPLNGPPYFEVGLTEGSTGLTVPQCTLLWNKTSSTSLVTAAGIDKWYDAKLGNAVYDELKLANGGLSNTQMDAILAWLPKYRDDIVNTLAKAQLNLPMEPYALGNTIFIGLGVAGGLLAVLGIVKVIRSKRSPKTT